MTLKNTVLSLLLAHQGDYLSGAEIAEKTGVSRNAVWKAIQRLQTDGYHIQGVPNRGYVLLDNGDSLSVPGIFQYLQHKDLILEYAKTVTTTMALGKQAAESGKNEGYVIVAESQTAGKGRMGRSFYSPPGTGVYFSILLRPKLSAEQSLLITTCAAVACAQAIEELSGQETQIKWVHDIYINGKKVCGILTEASLDLESGGLHYAVLGIGINLFLPQEGFPADIKSKAGALFEDRNNNDLRCRLVAAVLDRFFCLYPNIQDKEFLPEYRRRSMLTGETVDVLRGETSCPAIVKGIGDDFSLIVTYQDGSTARLSSGDVSVRKK